MKKLKQWLKGLLVLVLSFEMAACGTILYPERRGQKSGHLDVGVVLLDGIGLFFFIIPGVIAYVVDFGNGTIYFPEGGLHRVGGDQHAASAVKFDAANCTPESLSNIIKAQTGYRVDWQDKRLRMIKLKNKDEIAAYLEQAAPAQASLVSSR